MAQTLLIGLAFLSAAAAPVQAQYNGQHGQFYNGARAGGHGDYGGYTHRPHHGDPHYDNRYQGHGIGTGRGALIGGAGGAALGAIFGGGLKGSLIGGAAGAGIGAVAGHEHQKTVRRHDYERGYGH